MRIPSAQLKRDLLSKLGITLRGLNLRIEKRVNKDLLTRDQALWVEAYETKLPLGKYLEPNQINDLRTLVKQTYPMPLLVKRISNSSDNEHNVLTIKTKKGSRPDKIISWVEQQPWYRAMLIILTISGLISVVFATIALINALAH